MEREQGWRIASLGIPRGALISCGLSIPSMCAPGLASSPPSLYGSRGRNYSRSAERLAPLRVAGYQRMIARAGELAGFPFLISSHVLRHSCG